MKIIDFDARFFEFARKWMAAHPGLTEEQVEAILSALRIPAAVNKIGTEAFSYCGVWSVTFFGDAPQIGDNTFKGVQASVFYPKDAQLWNRKTTAQYGGTLTWEAT